MDLENPAASTPPPPENPTSNILTFYNRARSIRLRGVVLPQEHGVSVTPFRSKNKDELLDETEGEALLQIFHIPSKKFYSLFKSIRGRATFLTE